MAKRIVLVIALSVIVITLFFYYTQDLKSESSDYISTVNKNPYLKEFSIPSNSFPNALLVDKEGTVWITSKTSTLFSLNPFTNLIKKYDLKQENGQIESNSTTVWSMMQDNEGKIWFSQFGTNSIWRFDPTNNTSMVFTSSSGSPFQMKLGGNGEIWFTTLGGNTLGTIVKSDNGTTHYRINTIFTGQDSNPAGLYFVNNSIWIANEKGGYISQFKISRVGFSINYILSQNIPFNHEQFFSSPTDLVINKDIIWLTEHGTSFLTEYNMSTNQLNRYPTSQSPFHVTTLPFWIRSNNASEALWFNEHQGTKIALFNPMEKTLTEYHVPSLPKDGYLTYPLNIALDPRDDKILWFSEWNTDKVGMINGHNQIPFEISIDKKIIKLNSKNPSNEIKIEIKGDSPYNSNRVIMNVSSSIMSTAELGNLTTRFSSNLINLSNTHEVKLFLSDNGIAAGNYTLGISASDGYVTKTAYLMLQKS